jgi:transcriptional regulator with XRE-family HTH domain
MANAKGLFVEVTTDKVMRAAFRGARLRDNMTLKALAEAAGVRESLLMRYEHGQYLVRVQEVEGLKNAHKLLKLDPPDHGEPFEYGGAGVLPGSKMPKRKTKKAKKEVVTEGAEIETPVAPAPVQGRLFIPKTIMFGCGPEGKKFEQMLMILNLEKEGIIEHGAAKDAVYKLLQQLNMECV